MQVVRTLIQSLCCSDFIPQQQRHRNIRPIEQENNSSLLNRQNLDKPKIQTHIKGELPKISSTKSQNKSTSDKNINVKKLLLIDLDKTLIYYNEVDGFVMRPFLKQFLKSVSKFYIIYIFTAATNSYLQKMLALIRQSDGGAEYFSGFLTRQYCIPIHNEQNSVSYIKDIKATIKDYPTEKIVVVDDCPISYSLNPQNAVPINPFDGQIPDNQLIYLTQILLQIKDYEDVRDYIKGRYIFNYQKSLKSIQSTEDSCSPKKYQ